MMLPVNAALVLVAAVWTLGGCAGRPESAPGAPSLQQQYLELEDDLSEEDHVESARPPRSVLQNEEKTADFWRQAALSRLRSKTLEEPIRSRAKNVIMFLGDGMSIPTLTAARILDGGESSSLSFERFPYSGFSKTYCVDSQVADSACTSTAYLTGVKANLGTLGVTAAVVRSNCSAALEPDNQVTSIIRWAQDAGKRTGIVTTTRVTHASPAGGYAHAATRDWESDRDVRKDKQDPEQCPDIAKQLVTGDTGSNINVVLGGGRREFLPYKVRDEEGDKGHRKDGRDLIAEWSADKTARGINSTYVWDRQGLLNVDPDATDFLLGLFESSHMDYHMTANPETEPTLTEMTLTAISILRNEPKGYFLFVEGGKIDLAHHKSRARRALDETIEFAKAVQAAQELTSPKDTLIVVTADHAHTMSISGYPSRGNDIFGFAGISDVDKKPLTTISYANGPGYKQPERNGARYDVSHDNMGSDKYAYPAVAPRETETHGGDDVAVYSLGPWAHLLTGSFEQNLIPHVMAYAACIGPQVADGYCPGSPGSPGRPGSAVDAPANKISSAAPARASPTSSTSTSTTAAAANTSPARGDKAKPSSRTKSGPRNSTTR